MNTSYLPVFADENDRADGIQKVTGTARYAAEYPMNGLVHAVIVSSTIAKGTITSMQTRAAENAAGVLAVITHLNMPELPGYTRVSGDSGPGIGLKLMGSARVYYDGQPIAVVVADSYERAVHAASLVKADYARDKAATLLEDNLAKAKAPARGNGKYKRGTENAYQTAPVQVEAEYVLAQEVHNPMELGSITAAWDSADKLTVYTKTQGVKSAQRFFANVFGLQADNVRVIAPFVGGGFGMALRTWPYEIAAVVAAKKTGKPVKLMLNRSQMFTMVGYRPYTIQKVGIGATADGKLVGISHQATGVTASYEEFTEGVTSATRFMYECPNVDTSYSIVPLDISVPIWMRGPGEATGMFATESALDELAYKLNMDPVALRVKNFPEKDPDRGLPWSSNYIRDCYQLGTEKIGWNKRPAQPGTLTEDGWMSGYGMSCGVFGASRANASAKATLYADGRLLIQSAASDIGPGTSTMMVKIASETLAIPVEKIRYELGDSNLPPAPSQGGSGTTSAVGSAVYDACSSVKEKLAELAVQAGMQKEKLGFEKEAVTGGKAPVRYTELLRTNNLPFIEALRDSKGGEERQKYSFYSFSVHFTKVHVHPLTGVVKVKHVVTVGDAGRIVSPKTAASQMIGGVVGGIGMALTEEAIYDHRYGRYANSNFADYHVPVNADIPKIDALFVNKPDPHINPMGAKGMGEIALIGYAASLTNAVFNATGKRVRELPLTLDKLL